MNADRLASERTALINLCLYAYDRARSAAIAERIEDGLAQVGVTAIRPDGERFDPRSHEAGGTETTHDAGLDGTIAETELAGFTDRDAILRVPVVTVYRLEPSEQQAKP
jgi:molecular chaperone GrpE